MLNNIEKSYINLNELIHRLNQPNGFINFYLFFIFHFLTLNLGFARAFFLNIPPSLRWERDAYNSVLYSFIFGFSPVAVILASYQFCILIHGTMRAWAFVSFVLSVSLLLFFSSSFIRLVCMYHQCNEDVTNDIKKKRRNFFCFYFIFGILFFFSPVFGCAL